MPSAAAEKNPQPDLHLGGKTPTANRIALLDVLRGLALFGILVVNIEYFSQTILVGWASPEYRSPIDLVFYWIDIAFFQLKSYLLFAVLFGYGVGMQLAKLAENRSGIVKKHLRRMLVLILIGIAHAVFLFSADILVTYAIIGLLTMSFWKASSRFVLSWALVGYILCLIMGLVIIIAVPDDETLYSNLDVVVETYRSGSFVDIVQQRIWDVGIAFPFIFFIQGPMAFSMFLIGIAMARMRVLVEPQAHEGLYQKIIHWGLPIGLIGNALAATLMIMDATHEGLGTAIGFLLLIITGPILSFNYIAILALIFIKNKQPKWLLAERDPGRMSLTIYIFESFLGAMIFTGYGLGLFETIGPALGFLLAVVIWFVCIFFSRLWFKYFRFGPLEWLLRSGSYWRWQPLVLKH